MLIFACIAPADINGRMDGTKSKSLQILLNSVIHKDGDIFIYFNENPI